MSFLPENIEEYVTNHSQEEPELLKQLNRETWQKVLNPNMLSGAFQGRVLSMISKLVSPKNILEIGTYTGYSALCLAEGMQKEGKLITIDKNEELEEFCAGFFEKSDFSNQIEIIQIIRFIGINKYQVKLLFQSWNNFKSISDTMLNLSTEI